MASSQGKYGVSLQLKVQMLDKHIGGPQLAFSETYKLLSIQHDVSHQRTRPKLADHK